LGHINNPTKLCELVVDQHVRPERPNNDEAPQLTDGIWQLAEHCWASDPVRWPISDDICDQIRTILDNRESFRPTSADHQVIESGINQQYLHDGEFHRHWQVPVNGLFDIPMLSSSHSANSQWHLPASQDATSSKLGTMEPLANDPTPRPSAHDSQPASQEANPSKSKTSATSSPNCSGHYNGPPFQLLNFNNC
jgi:hypothetical protein